MNSSDYPHAKEADICLILEGTYPFVDGGVSHWVYELIRAFPQYSFAVIFLGTQAEDYPSLRYPLAKNLVHLEAHYLFEPQKKTRQSTPGDINPEQLQKIAAMHDSFGSFLSSSTCPMSEMSEMSEIFELFEHMDPKKDLTDVIDERLFLRSRSAWAFILERYNKNHADQSFFDYFWGVRNLHRPFWPLAKILNNIPKVKVLHSASTGYAGFLGALLKNKYRIPYILTEHGIYTKERWIDLMRNYFFEHIIIHQKPFEQDKGLISIWLNFFSILAKIGYAAANPIISLFAEYQNRQINDGADPMRAKIISYGIDFEQYPFLGKPNPQQNNPVIACIGRVVPIKDVKTFIRTSALIIQKIPQAEAWIIGSLTEDEAYVTSCMNLVKTLELEDNIKFLGIQNVMDIFPKIDLLILSSISEGSPFVILESLAVGIPVVATKVGGCEELIHGNSEEDKALGRAGRIVNIGDPHSLAEAARELLTDPSAWRQAQRTGVTRLRRYYSMQSLVDHYGLIYKQAMG
jgi:glycosyltransferase involved in cell wall biosynthesis